MPIVSYIVPAYLEPFYLSMILAEELEDASAGKDDEIESFGGRRLPALNGWP